MNRHHEEVEAYRDREYLDQLIDERAAANFMGFTVRALQNWRVRGGGPEYVKIGKRAVRYQRRTLLAWAKDLTVSHTSEAARA